jgi:hypothetical protein
MDAASEKLLNDDLEDRGDSESSEEYIQPPIRLRRRYRLLETVCALTALTIGLLAAYFCGVRLVLVKTGTTGSRTPSMIADCR